MGRRILGRVCVRWRRGLVSAGFVVLSQRHKLAMSRESISHKEENLRDMYSVD